MGPGDPRRTAARHGARAVSRRRLRPRRGVRRRGGAAQAHHDQRALRPGAVSAAGVHPAKLITPSAHFAGEAVGIEPPTGVRVHVSGVALTRDEEGNFRVLEDTLPTPSGVSYVIENRRAMTQTLPSLFT